MQRTDQLEQNATRVELDQRSRDARLRLEHVERLLVGLPLTRQSLLRRVLRRLEPRTHVGRQIAGRSANANFSRGQSRQRGEIADETGGVAGDFPATPSAFWPRCTSRALVSQIQAEPSVSPSGPTIRIDLGSGIIVKRYSNDMISRVRVGAGDQLVS
jgi:hypothetical protein